jgi:hypothetical protein
MTNNKIDTAPFSYQEAYAAMQAQLELFTETIR